MPVTSLEGKICMSESLKSIFNIFVLFFSMTLSPFLVFSASPCLLPAFNPATHFRGSSPPLRDTTRKTMVKSETRGWRWTSFEGSLIIARKRGGVVAINYLDFSKEFVANRGHQ